MQESGEKDKDYNYLRSSGSGRLDGTNCQDLRLDEEDDLVDETNDNCDISERIHEINYECTDCNDKGNAIVEYFNGVIRGGNDHRRGFLKEGKLVSVGLGVPFSPAYPKKLRRLIDSLLDSIAFKVRVEGIDTSQIQKKIDDTSSVTLAVDNWNELDYSIALNRISYVIANFGRFVLDVHQLFISLYRYGLVNDKEVIDRMLVLGKGDGIEALLFALAYEDVFGKVITITNFNDTWDFSYMDKVLQSNSGNVMAEKDYDIFFCSRIDNLGMESDFEFAVTQGKKVISLEGHFADRSSCKFKALIAKDMRYGVYMDWMSWFHKNRLLVKPKSLQVEFDTITKQKNVLRHHVCLCHTQICEVDIKMVVHDMVCLVSGTIEGESEHEILSYYQACHNTYQMDCKLVVQSCEVDNTLHSPLMNATLHEYLYLFGAIERYDDYKDFYKDIVNFVVHYKNINACTILKTRFSGKNGVMFRKICESYDIRRESFYKKLIRLCERNISPFKHKDKKRRRIK
jgi:hypothetical protein